jgi:hypothetical protein
MIACKMTNAPIGNSDRVFVAIPHESVSPFPAPLSEAALLQIPLTEKGGIRHSHMVDISTKVIEVHEAKVVGNKVLKADKKNSFVFSIPADRAIQIIPELLNQAAKKRLAKIRSR